MALIENFKTQFSYLAFYRTMSFFLCEQPNCNRKYKTPDKWVKHVMQAHGIVEPVLPHTVQLNQRSFKNRDLKQANDLKRQTELSAARAKFQEESNILAEKEFAASRAAAYLADKERLLEEQRQLNEIQAELVNGMRAMQDRLNRDPEGCCICAERPSDASVVPCGHAFFCFVCLTNQFDNFRSKGCPYCRQPMERVMSLFQ